MIKGYQNKKVNVRLNSPLRGFRDGQVVRVVVDSNGVPIERYWRDRFKDAQTDGCLEVITTKTAKKKKEKED